MSRAKLAWRPLVGGVGIVPSTTRRWATLGVLAQGHGRRWLVTAAHAVGAVAAGQRVAVTQGPWGQPGHEVADALDTELLVDAGRDLAAVPLLAGVGVTGATAGLGPWPGLAAVAVGDAVVMMGASSGLVRGEVVALTATGFRVGRPAGAPAGYLLGESGDSGAAWLTWPALGVAGVHTGLNAAGEALASDAAAVLAGWGLGVV